MPQTWQTTNASMLEFLEERGLATVTEGKKSRSWLEIKDENHSIWHCYCACHLYSKLTSFPLKILATKVPPERSTWVLIFRAARSSCAWWGLDFIFVWTKNFLRATWMYSSISWRPVTSGAPSHTTRSALPSIISTILKKYVPKNCLFVWNITCLLWQAWWCPLGVAEPQAKAPWPAMEKMSKVQTTKTVTVSEEKYQYSHLQVNSNNLNRFSFFLRSLTS